MPLPLVSMIVPCWNEEDSIGLCLASILQNDYPKDRLEVLVVDGMSDDDTRSTLEPFVKQYSFIRLIDNPRTTTSAALNIGIAAAKGDVIMCVDARYEYPTHYVSRLVQWLEESEADNVGGVLRVEPATGSATARAIALAVAHPFGVGNAHYRLGVSGPRSVDTVPFDCYRRDVFDRFGTFDEDLPQDQDLEFNMRLRNRGGKVLLVPDIEIHGEARTSLRQLIRLSYQYGYFTPSLLGNLDGRAKLRQVAAPAFVLSLLVTGILAPWFPWLAKLFLAIFGSYLIVMVASSVAMARKHGVACALRLPLVFAIMHFCHGYGFLQQLFDFGALPSRRESLPSAGREAPSRADALPRHVSASQALTPVLSRFPASAVTSLESATVSIVLPCRNEVNWIAGCLESIAHNDYPKDRLEVFVVDGMSDDGTRAIVEKLAAEYPYMRLLENPRRTTPAALNIGITAAQGDVIIRMDAHSEYPANYIGKLVYWLERSGADDVGGLWIMRPSTDTPTARAITLGLSTLFGAGNAQFRLGSADPCWVDTVPFGCYRREVFDRIGVFDEELLRNQDNDFNLRLCKAGGSILLVPEVVAYYYTRDSLRKLWRTHYQFGYFTPLLIRKTGWNTTVRQWIPPMFVLALLVSGLLAPWFAPAAVLFAAIVVAYTIPLVLYALGATRRHGLQCGLLLPVVFFVLHVARGCGVWKGVWDFVILRKRITVSNEQEIPISR